MKLPDCPQCHRSVPASDMNVATDTFYCRNCNAAEILSQLIATERLLTEVNIDRPPEGCGRVHRDGKVVITCRTKAPRRMFVGMNAVGGLAFVAFALMAPAAVVVGLHQKMEVAPDPWEVLVSESMMGVGVAFIFCILFLAIGLFILWNEAKETFGHLEIEVAPSTGSLFTGVCRWGQRQAFKPGEITRVAIEEERWSDSEDGDQIRISVVVELLNGARLQFGETLADEQRQFLAAALLHAVRTTPAGLQS